MFKAFFALGLAFYLLVLPGALAGPSCARRNRNKQSCMSLCAQRWGWPGNVMGNDPWGAVISPKGSSPGDALSNACSNGNSGSDNGALGSDPKNSDTSIAIVPSSSPPPGSASNSKPSTPVITTSFITSTTTAPRSTSTLTSTSTKSSTVTKPQGDSTTPKATSTPAPPPPTKETPAQNTPSINTFQQLASSPSPSQTSQPKQNINSQPSGSSDVTAMLQLHNNLRAQHGAGPLSWSDNLASKAQQWANGCVFKHSGGSLGPFGENLASGTGSSYGATDAFNDWAAEASSYNSGNPQPSHFTQIVWKATTQVGCALATCGPGTLFSSSFGSSKFYVCEYEAQGNVVGAFGANVQV